MMKSIGISRTFLGRTAFKSRPLTSCCSAKQTQPLFEERHVDRRWEIKMLYDGDCPLCMREVDMLKRRDADAGRISFVDIAASDYDPRQNSNISFEQAMGEIHAILPDGRVVTGIEVFRRLYDIVGLGWVYSLTRIPAVERAANAIYNIWATYRLPITGRPDLGAILAEKKTCGGARNSQ